ncbi:hypothetical protein D3C84_1098440 [compost metagenome]
MHEPIQVRRGLQLKLILKEDTAAVLAHHHAPLREHHVIFVGRRHIDNRIAALGLGIVSDDRRVCVERLIRSVVRVDHKRVGPFGPLAVKIPSIRVCRRVAREVS